jgi:hypothetical protein
MISISYIKLTLRILGYTENIRNGCSRTDPIEREHACGKLAAQGNHNHHNPYL